MNTEKILLFCCFSVWIVHGCKQENNQKDKNIDPSENSSVNSIVRVNQKKLLKDTLLISLSDFIPCSEIINKAKKMSYVKSSSKLIKDPVVPMRLYPYYIDKGEHGFIREKGSTDSVIKRVFSYYYKDSINFYIHTYKDLKKQKVIFDRVMGLNNKLTANEILGKVGERVLFYFRGDTDKNDIILLDIPPNWNHWQLKDELVKYLEANINCVYLFCEGMNPCEFKNLSNDP